MGEYFIFRAEKIFVTMTENPEAIKERTDKFQYIKTNFCISKNTRSQKTN